MTEVFFYHLERRTLDDVLPELLTKTLERGWRALVRAGSAERVAALDTHLWTYSPNAFLPHGTAADGHAARQPVFLTAKDEGPHAANVIFFVDGAAPGDWAAPGVADRERVVVIFDGADTEAVAVARDHWKSAAAAGHAVTYWRQNERGVWAKLK